MTSIANLFSNFTDLVKPKSVTDNVSDYNKNNSNPIKGVNLPFKLKFSTIGDGVDVLTSLKVSQTMDASDNKGNQLGVVLNTTNIKLTGYNNF